MTKTFDSLGVNPDILKAIKDLGFENPTPVQEKVIPLLLAEKTDIVALAQTGTGKTAAFGLPLIQQTDAHSGDTQGLVLAPTRELCIQITKDLQSYSKYTDKLNIVPVYGGASIIPQIKSIKRGAQIVVATPGRLLDLIDRKAINLNTVNKVVLDEADEMLNMGFTDSINAILAEVPKDRNTLLFSATMPDDIVRISKKYMRNPQEVTIGNRNSGAENVTHTYYAVHPRDRYLVLKRIADFNPGIYGIVFCRTKRETQEVADKLIQDGYNADSLHGDLSQAQRDYVMQKFRVKNINLLIATDVAARGLDVDNLTHVINFGLPDDFEVYTHRSGRTGRAGKAGASVAIIHPNDTHVLRRIEKKINKSFVKGTIPTGKEVCEKQLFNLIDKMQKVEVDHTEIDEYLPAIYLKLENMDKEELVKRFVSLEFNRFLEYYKKSHDIAAPHEQGGRENGRGAAGYTRLFMNLGKMDELSPNAVIEMINDKIPGEKIPVGKIDLMQNFSFIEVVEQHAELVMTALNQAYFNNKKVSVEVAKGPGGGGGRRNGSRFSGGGGGGFRSKGRSGGYGGNRERSFSRSNDGGGGSRTRFVKRKNRRDD